MDSIFDLLLVVVCVIVPLGGMVHLLLQHELTLKLQAEGLRAHGTVVHVDKDTGAVVEYVFHLPDGEEIRSHFKESDTRGWIPREGDPVEVRYLAHNPNRNQCVGLEVGLAKLLVQLLVLVFWMGTGVVGLMKHFDEQHATPPSRQLHAPYDEAAQGAVTPRNHRPSQHEPLPAGRDMPREFYLLLALGILIPLVLMVRLLSSHGLTLKLRREGLHARGTVLRTYSDSESSTTTVVYVFHSRDGEQVRGQYEERGVIR
jgi:hypothetical protein